MDFNQCYNIIKEKFYSMDLEKIDTDFSAVMCLKDENKNYVYMAYKNGERIIEPVKHDSANIFISLSTETFQNILEKRLDPFKAFTTGKIQAKGNVFLALSLFKKIKI